MQAREILDYFLRNPQAADSLEGVARWRLMGAKVHRSVEEVDRALDWLVTNGFLVREPVIGSAPIYSLNRDKTAEAERFLESARTARSKPGGRARDE